MLFFWWWCLSVNIRMILFILIIPFATFNLFVGRQINYIMPKIEDECLLNRFANVVSNLHFSHSNEIVDFDNRTLILKLTYNDTLIPKSCIPTDDYININNYCINPINDMIDLFNFFAINPLIWFGVVSLMMVLNTLVCVWLLQMIYLEIKKYC